MTDLIGVFHDDRRKQVGPLALLVHIAALAYIEKRGTDDRITPSDIRVLARWTCVYQSIIGRVVHELVDQRLWTERALGPRDVEYRLITQDPHQEGETR